MEERFSNIIIDLDNIQLGLKLHIVAKKSKSLFDIGENNQEYNEARFQLVEGHFYDYKISDETCSLGDVGYSIIQSNSFLKHSGKLAPNIYTGTLNIPILKSSTENGKEEKKEIGVVSLEVRSAKTGYREDYRDMLEYITEKCTDLLLQSTSPTQHYFTPDFEKDSQTLYQQFAFLQSILGTDEFDIAINRIIHRPVTQWIQKKELTDIRSVKRFSGSQVRQLARGVQRSPLPSTHPLRKNHLKSIPTRIEDFRKTDSVDTPENRFIKYCLENFLRFIEGIQAYASQLNESNSTKKERLVQEAELLIGHLESYLHHSFFKDISRPTTLRLNSPVLQKRNGYREVLRVWLMFDLAAKLIWKGGEDVYGAGKKDVANLYEYWLFFQLLDILSEKFDIPSKELDKLIVYDKQKFSLTLKQGKFTAIKGIYTQANRNLNIRFNYNRSFNQKQIEKGYSYPHSGSWTINMRPDYTLSIWPEGIDEEDAENDELIVHIHFDAKYKVENFQRFFSNKTPEELDKEKEDYRKGVYKNADILKMHAYKDAIRRTGGAYVLYPGETNKQFFGFHEIVPGLGAFALNPKGVNKGKNNLSKFIDEVIEHFLNQSSQREKMAYRTYSIHRKKPNKDNIVKEPAPLNIGINRHLIPDNISVLVGFYPSSKHLEWYEKSKCYNLRIGTRRGSVSITKELLDAEYLLLHTERDHYSTQLYKICKNKKGPKINSRKDLIKKGYPTKNSDPAFYLMLEIADIDEPSLLNKKWDFKKLQGFESHRQSGNAFTTNLTDLLKNKFDPDQKKENPSRLSFPL